MSNRIPYLAFIVSTLGILLISFISPSIRPPSSRLSDISVSSIEKTVLVVGNVTRSHTFEGGSMILTLSEGDSTLDVYLPLGVAKEYHGVELEGRMVEVTGDVKIYKGRLEVVADRPGNVRLK